MSETADATPAERVVALRVARVALACREAGGLVLAALEQPELYSRLLADAVAAPPGVPPAEALSPGEVAASSWEDDFAEATAAVDLLPAAPTPEEREAADAAEAAASAASEGALFRTPGDVAADDAAAGWRPSPDQEEALTALLVALETPGTYVLTGAAGCHAPGTRILLASGETRAVEAVRVGDRLMGMDGRPRTVLRLVRGWGPLVRITPVKGSSFVVNEDHILTLVHSGDKYGRGGRTGAAKPVRRDGDLIDVAVRDLGKLPGRADYKLFRTGVGDFFNEGGDRPLNPYFLGILLGDGSSGMSGDGVSIAKPDPEIEACARENAALFGMHIRVTDRTGRGNLSYRFRGAGYHGPRHRNALRTALTALGLWGKGSGERFVPEAYRTGPRCVREALLAGLLDTDGHRQARGGYDYVSKSEQLANDVAFLARSVGMAAYVRPCQKWCQTGAVGTYFRVTLSGDSCHLPMRIPRKIALPRTQKKSVLRTGFSVTPVGEGAFYGFTVDGDNRYLLDDFTVTHNCGKTTVLKALLRRLTPQWGVTLLAPTWRAALRMREVIGQDARSVHSAVYGKPTEQRRCTCGTWSKELMRHVDRYFEVDEQDRPVGSGVEDAEPGRVKLPRYVCPSCAAQHEDAALLPHRLDFEGKAKAEGPEGGRALVVIDEASMVAAREVRAIASAFDGVETRILYVGDANQLDPVEDGDAPGAPPEAASPEAAALPDLLHPTAALHTVHRQAGDSPILRIAHALKSVPVPSTAEWPFPARASGVDVRLKAPLAEVADWAARHRCAGSDVALIACSNKTRARLNAAVRATTGAARVAGGALIPGDRLLSRTNSKAGLFNGELWTLCTIERVPAGTALLDHRGRAPVKHPRYEHDRVLSYGVGVWRVELAAVGAEGHRAHALIVAPVAEHGGPVLESDLILHANYEPRTARQACREIARCWASEYAAAVSAMELEYQEARSGALYKRVAEARLLTYLAARDFAGIKARYAVLERYAPKGVHGSLPRIAALLDMTPEARAQAIRAFDRPEDVAAECATVAEYARRVYGALDPARVGVLDYGEALTCHAMQGSQAAHVGVVFDSGFWGMWRHERAAGLKWAYTAVTRASERLALFSLRKEGA